MSDASPEYSNPSATPDRPRPDAEAAPGDRARPEQDAHGGSMAPGLVDDTGHLVADPPPADPAE